MDQRNPRGRESIRLRRMAATLRRTSGPSALFLHRTSSCDSGVFFTRSLKPILPPGVCSRIGFAKSGHSLTLLWATTSRLLGRRFRRRRSSASIKYLTKPDVSPLSQVTHTVYSYVVYSSDGPNTGGNAGLGYETTKVRHNVHIALNVNPILMQLLI